MKKLIIMLIRINIKRIENNDSIDLTLGKICDIIDKNTRIRKR